MANEEESWGRILVSRGSCADLQRACEDVNRFTHGSSDCVLIRQPGRILGDHQTSGNYSAEYMLTTRAQVCRGNNAQSAAISNEHVTVEIPARL